MDTYSFGVSEPEPSSSISETDSTDKGNMVGTPGANVLGNSARIGGAEHGGSRPNSGMDDPKTDVEAIINDSESDREEVFE